MTQLALITWRLPHTPQARLEPIHEATHATPHPTTFALTTCQRVLHAAWTSTPQATLDRIATRIDAAGGERYTGHQALQHLARVAAGLDALVPGEDQAPHQFRQALHEQHDQLPPSLQERLERARALARDARAAGGLTGHRTRSLLDLATPHLPPAGPTAILGTGTMARQALQTLPPHHEVHVVSRARKRAATIAPETATSWDRDRFFQDPPRLAALILCTTATDKPLLDAATAARLADARARKDPLHVLDLGLPRNADPTLLHHDALTLTTLDDLSHTAATRPTQDPRIQRARNALAERLERERRRRDLDTADERIIALREALQDTLHRLAHEHDTPHDADAWIQQAHNRIAHTSQEHLQAALQGDPPP